MQDKIYIELKIKENKVNSLNLQLNFNRSNNINCYDLVLRIEQSSKDLKQFKKDNHL